MAGLEINPKTHVMENVWMLTGCWLDVDCQRGYVDWDASPARFVPRSNKPCFRTRCCSSFALRMPQARP